MQATVIFSCLVLVMGLQTVVSYSDNLSPNQPLHRQKRFFAELGAIIAGLRSGVKFVNIVNQIFGLDTSKFGQVIKKLAQFDVPDSTKVYDHLETMKQDQMSKIEKERANLMMFYLRDNMETNGSGHLVPSSVKSLALIATVLLFLARGILY